MVPGTIIEISRQGENTTIMCGDMDMDINVDVDVPAGDFAIF